MLMLSQITSPVISCVSAVNLQSAPFAPLCPHPRALEFPVHFKKKSFFADGVMATFFR